VIARLAGVDRRLLVAAAGLAGVVLGWALLVTVFGGGSDDEMGLPIRSGAGAAVARTTVPPAPAVSYAPPSRDPFNPNVTVPKTSSGQATVQGVPTVTPTTSVPSSATTPAISAAATTAQAALELKAIGRDGSGTLRATITVDGQPFTPAKGEAFSHAYLLENIDGSCVEVSAQTARARMCLATPKP
jgi:hypothetical protein